MRNYYKDYARQALEKSNEHNAEASRLALNRSSKKSLRNISQNRAYTYNNFINSSNRDGFMELVKKKNDEIANLDSDIDYHSKEAQKSKEVYDAFSKLANQKSYSKADKKEYKAYKKAYEKASLKREKNRIKDNIKYIKRNI